MGRWCTLLFANVSCLGLSKKEMFLFRNHGMLVCCWPECWSSDFVACCLRLYVSMHACLLFICLSVFVHFDEIVVWLVVCVLYFYPELCAIVLKKVFYGCVGVCFCACYFAQSEWETCVYRSCRIASIKLINHRDDNFSQAYYCIEIIKFILSCLKCDIVPR
jgi:hypothetical protein